MWNRLKTAKKVVGVKQLKKALKEDMVQAVFLAKDADPRLTDPIIQKCQDLQIELVMVPTKEELGKACGIDVGAAAAAIIV